MSFTPPSFTRDEFRKPARSEPNKNCVQVARRDGWVELRDDKVEFGAPDDHRLVFTAEEFDAFLAGTRAAQTDGLCLEITRRNEDGVYLFRRNGWAAVELAFTEGEVVAFWDGVSNGEFDRAAYAT